MSVVSMLLGQPQRGTRITRNINLSGISAAILIDATLKEEFSAPSELTQHPVENGADIADHIIIKPQTVKIEGTISETPFSIKGQIAGIASTVASQVGIGLGGALGGVAATAIAAKTLAGVLAPPSVTGGEVQDMEGAFRSSAGLPGENIRLRDAVREFLSIRDAKLPVTVISGLKVYYEFVLTEFSVMREQASGQSMRVMLTFQELLLSTTQEVSAVSVPGSKNALGTSDLGSKATTPETNSNTTIAYDLIFGG